MWILTPRYQNISQYFHPDHLSSHYGPSFLVGFSSVQPWNQSCFLRANNLDDIPRTQGGIFTTPGDAYTTPVDMWVKALGPSPFHFPLVQRNQFLLPAFTLSFFGISILLVLHSDLLLEKLHRNHDLARIRAIGGSAQVFLHSRLLRVT